MDSNHRFRVAQTVKPSWEAGLVSRKRERICWGTEGSNPSPSSGESVSLPQPLSKVENPGFPRGFAAAPASAHLPLLSGEITFKIGDEVTVGGPGSCAFLPRGVPHAWENTGAETGRVLFLATPAGAGRFFEE